MHTCPLYQTIMVKRVESDLQLLDHDTEYFDMDFQCTAPVLVLQRNLSLGSYVFLTRSYVHGGAWRTMVGATFKGMC